MKMTMHTEVVVTLTKKGAEILNEKNKKFLESIKNNSAVQAYGFKTDYKENDEHCCMLWQLMELFGLHCYNGAEVPFITMKYRYEEEAAQQYRDAIMMALDTLEDMPEVITAVRKEWHKQYDRLLGYLVALNHSCLTKDQHDIVDKIIAYTGEDANTLRKAEIVYDKD